MNFHALTLLGTLQLQRGDFGEAERLLGRSLGIEPRQPLALNNTRHLEAAYARMWDRYRGGELPATFRIAALARP